MPRVPSLLVLGVLIVSTSVAVPGGRQDSLLSEIRRLEATYGGRLGLMARHLRTGEEIRYRADERFPTASLIKFPVMTAFYSRVDKGLLDPKARVTLTQADIKPGSGLLQSMVPGMSLALQDAVRLMIVVSDNTATNLVIDSLAPTHDERMKVVNDFLISKGLKNTRLLNRLYTWETKKQTGESIRFGIGVSTPADMVLLLEGLYRGTLADSSSTATMMQIMKEQFYGDMIPRFLPADDVARLETAHKTGGINEVKTDAGLVLSDKGDYAIAIFVDKHMDHRDGVDNQALLLAAHVSRAVWNHFMGGSGYVTRKVVHDDVDWTRFPGGSWAIYRSPAAPFPHPGRRQGYTRSDGTTYPFFPHYADSSIVVVVPEGFKETAAGANVIVHFHGHTNDNIGVLEQMEMPQALARERVNALLVIPQGPNRVPDSFGGKMEDPGGLARLVDDVLRTMQKEGILTVAKPARVIVSAHSGGYRPAAYVLHQGGLTPLVTDVFLFDALYGEQAWFREWLLGGNGRMVGAYTEHLAGEHLAFERELGPQAGDRLRFAATSVPHDSVVNAHFGPWLKSLGPEWRLPDRGTP